MDSKEENTKTVFRESETFLNRCLLYWSIGSVVLGLTVSILSLPVESNSALNHMAKLTPSIEKWTDESQHREVAKITWIYMVYSAPVIIAILVIQIKAVEIRKPVLGFLFILLFAIMMSYPFIDGSFFGIIDIGNVTMDKGGGGTGLHKLYKRTVVGTILVSNLMGASFIFSYTYFFLILKQSLVRKLCRRMRDGT